MHVFRKTSFYNENQYVQAFFKEYCRSINQENDNKQEIKVLEGRQRKKMCRIKVQES